MILHETLPIGNDGWVLEIGSGHDPHPRSDILVDNALESDAEREGRLIKDRPLVLAHGESLPFADKSFDFVVCSHVVEHAKDPKALLDEIMRVGKAGYIETPNSVGERLFNWPYHRWLLDVENGTLVMRQKREQDVVFGYFFHHLNAAYWEVRWFLRRHKDLFHVRYFWKDSFPFRIETPANGKAREDFLEEIKVKDASDGSPVRAVSQEKGRRSLINSAVAAAKKIVAAVETLPIRLGNAGRRRGASDYLAAHLACPACKKKGGLRLAQAKAECGACGAVYATRSGYWDFRAAS